MNDTQRRVNNESVAYPSGKQFLKLFSKEADVKHLPYMYSDSLDKDIILYKAMIIILSKRLGILEERISIDDRDDETPSDELKRITEVMKSVIVATERFMKGLAMIALRDNSVANGRHENRSRLSCYRFLIS